MAATQYQSPPEALRRLCCPVTCSAIAASLVISSVRVSFAQGGFRGNLIVELPFSYL